MPADPWGEPSVAARLLAHIADPAVLVDKAGRLVASNAAARGRLGIPEDAGGRGLAELVGARLASGRRVALADATDTLVVWSLDDGGLGPDDAALEKLDLLQRLAGSAGHELNNPLNAFMGFAELLATDPSLPRDLREIAATIGDAATKAGLVTRTYLDLARGFIRMEPPTALTDIVSGIESLVNHPGISMQRRVNLPPSLPSVGVDLARVQWILFAVVANGLEAQGTRWTPGAQGAPGRLLISGRHIDDDRGDRVRVAIEDGGPELSEEERAALFSGSGVGRATRDLAVARSLVTQSGGRLSHERVPGGNRIVVEFPVAGTALPPADSEPEALPEMEVAPLVLVYDSETYIRSLLVRYLARLGVQAIEARDGREALAILSQEPVSMVIAEFPSSGAGRELYERAVQVRPDLAKRYVAVSADPGNANVIAFGLGTGVTILPKPFDEARLRQLVCEATGVGSG